MRPTTLSPVDLLGTWRLERRVLDRVTNTSGRMTGTLTLTRSEAGIRWYEHGTFEFGGRTFDSSRDLLLRADGDNDDGDGWTMCFADSREFHPWRPGQLVEHPCRADTYRGVVDVTPSRLRTLWDVTGPAKNQRLITRCYRT